MSFIKYRVREVAADFGMTPKEVSEVAGKYFDKPKSNSQVLTDEQLNVIFDHITQNRQIDSLEQVFAAAKKPEPKPAKESPKAAAPVKSSPAVKAAAPAPKSEIKPEAKPEPKPVQPERKRERRVVDTSAVLDVQVAGADAGQGHPHDGVPVILQNGLRLVQQRKFSLFNVSIGQHSVLLFLIGSACADGPKSLRPPGRIRTGRSPPR